MDEESLGIHTHIRDSLGGNINIGDIGNALTVAELEIVHAHRAARSSRHGIRCKVRSRDWYSWSQSIELVHPLLGVLW
jgi:hypothetical protein